MSNKDQDRKKGKKKVKKFIVLISGLVLDFCYVPKNAKNLQKVPKVEEKKFQNFLKRQKKRNNNAKNCQAVKNKFQNVEKKIPKSVRT